MTSGRSTRRANRPRWIEEGGHTLGERARAEVEAKIATWEPTGLGDDVRNELIRRMEGEARSAGADRLPDRE